MSAAAAAGKVQECSPVRIRYGTPSCGNSYKKLTRDSRNYNGIGIDYI